MSTPDVTESGKVEIGHVLAIDVVGYSRLLLDQQTELLAQLNQSVRGTTRFRVAQAAGRLISLPTGDGMALVFFGEPDAALECAVEIASALKGHPNIRLRMGIHSGPVNRLRDVNEGQNAAGAGIDMAQRVMDCGDAGHILLSRRVAYDMAPLPRWNKDLYELGECEVKHGLKVSLVNFYTNGLGNSATPAKLQLFMREQRARDLRQRWRRRLIMAAALLVLFALAGLAGLLIHRRFAQIGPPTQPVSPPEKSIAVMPFVDMSQTKDQEYFCDGISEEILGALAKVEGLRVVARTSSFSFKSKNMDMSEIGRALNVSTVLEGTVRREGDTIRISADLVSVRDGYRLWAHQYERKMQGVFALEDEITQQIVAALKVKMAVNQTPRPELNIEAYDLYMRGLALSNKSTEPEMRKSLDFFQQALAKDPKLSRAWTGIAKDWLWLSDAFVAPREAMPEVEKAARHALALDDSDAAALAYLGEVKRVLMWDVKGAEGDLTRALEIDPNSPEVHLFMALLQSCLGHPDVARQHIDEAVRLDPLSPIISSWHVHILILQQRLDEALREAKRTMEIDPDYSYFEPALAHVYREQGKLREALDIYLRVARTTGQPSTGLAMTYARLGKKDEALKVINELVELRKRRYYAGDLIAEAYVALGDKDAAFQWLDRAVEEHSAPIHRISFDPAFATLRSDPRFPPLLARIGLNPSQALQGH